MLTPDVFSTLFTSFLTLKVFVKIYLNLHHQKNIKLNRHQVPVKFKDTITLIDHQKAADYNRLKIHWENFTFILDIIWLVILIPGGVLNQLDQYARSFNQTEIITGLIFLGLYSVITFIIDLPQSLFSTFYIEEKFGFNKTTPKVFVIDLLKQIVLSLVLGLPIITGLLWIMQKLDQSWWFFGWLFLTIIQFVILWLYPIVIAPLFNKFTPLPDGEMKDKIIKLLEKVNFNFSGLFVMDASKRSAHGNAYFTGLGKNKRIVFFDTLLKNLSPEEAEAVLAHELGHFKKKHILKSLIMSLVFSFIGFAILGYLYKNQAFYQGHFIKESSSYMGLFLFSMVSSLYTFPLIPIFTYLSRKNEFEADEFAATHSSAQSLILALTKLYKDNAGTLTPDKLYSQFYYSHPPAFERVEFLEKFKS